MKTELPSNDAPLSCPRCGGTCTRHREVHVYVAPKGGSSGVWTIVGEDGRASSLPAGDFHGRGNDIRIAIGCATCGQVSWLHLALDDGRSFLVWQGRKAVLARVRNEDDARGLADRLAKRFGVRVEALEEPALDGSFVWTIVVGMRAGVQEGPLRDFVAGYLGGIADEGVLVAEGF